MFKGIKFNRPAELDSASIGWKALNQVQGDEVAIAIVQYSILQMRSCPVIFFSSCYSPIVLPVSDRPAELNSASIGWKALNQVQGDEVAIAIV